MSYSGSSNSGKTRTEGGDKFEPVDHVRAASGCNQNNFTASTCCKRFCSVHAMNYQNLSQHVHANTGLSNTMQEQLQSSEAQAGNKTCPVLLKRFANAVAQLLNSTKSFTGLAYHCSGGTCRRLLWSCTQLMCLTAKI